MRLGLDASERRLLAALSFATSGLACVLCTLAAVVLPAVSLSDGFTGWALVFAVLGAAAAWATFRAAVAARDYMRGDGGGRRAVWRFVVAYFAVALVGLPTLLITAMQSLYTPFAVAGVVALLAVRRLVVAVRAASAAR